MRQLAWLDLTESSGYQSDPPQNTNAAVTAQSRRCSTSHNEEVTRQSFASTAPAGGTHKSHSKGRRTEAGTSGHLATTLPQRGLPTRECSSR